MITAVDSNILIDVLNADPTFGETSRRALNDALDSGRVIACGTVWAEVCATLSPAAEVARAIEQFGVLFDPMNLQAAIRAGDAWRRYRRRGGKRTRLIADFIVAAHASERADRLLTRDRGFYKAHFRALTLTQPSSR